MSIVRFKPPTALMEATEVARRLRALADVIERGGEPVTGYQFLFNGVNTITWYRDWCSGGFSALVGAIERSKHSLLTQYDGDGYEIPPLGGDDAPAT